MISATVGQLVVCKKRDNVIGRIVLVFDPGTVGHGMCEVQIPRPESIPPEHLYRGTHFACFEDLDPA